MAAASMRWLARATLAMLAVAWADDCHDRNIDCSDWAEEGKDSRRDARLDGWNTARCLAGSARRARAPARAPTRGGGEL